MDPLPSSPIDEMRLCSNCGSWIRRDRTHCPWCQAEQSVLNETALDVPPPKVPPPLPPVATRPSPIGRRSVIVALVGALLLLIGATTVGAYQGWQDRRAATQHDAISYFEQGQQLLTDGQYELAIANFREALRLEPHFAAAEHLLRIAEQQAAAPPSAPGTVVATSLPAADNERLFAEATKALVDEQWEIAAATYDVLATQAPDFRTEEVQEGLFRARRGAAEAALAVEDFASAIRHIDQALAIRPDDQSLIAKRRMISAYRTAQAAIRSQNWTVAADQLRSVYVVDPEFLDVADQLAMVHLQLADAFAKKDIWCQAAQNYRASNSVKPDREVAADADAAERRCSLRATAAPIRATRTPGPTEEVTRTPGVTTTAVVSGTLVPILTVTPTVIVSPITPTIPPPTTTPVPSAYAFYNTGIGESIDSGCGGHYIIGTTRAPDGAPIANVTVVAADDYGNRYVVASKADPLGSYNIPIPAQVITYRVWVANGDQVISPVVTITHSDRFAQAGAACHIVDWQQSR